MQRKITCALTLGLALATTSAWATNGDNLIGTGAKSRSMGGTGIAHFHGVEAATTNPALIAKAKGTEFAFGGTYFRPDVQVTTQDVDWAGGLGTTTGGSYTSEARNNVIPYVALTRELDDGFVIGASMYGSAGMGTDWRSAEPSMSGWVPPEGTLGLFSMRSNLLLLKFSVPVAYGQDNWSIGLAPVLMYGALDVAYEIPVLGEEYGKGSSNDFGFGYELGAHYAFTDTGFSVGIKYQSPISMTYDYQITGAADNFGVTGLTDELEQPAEIGFGVDWTEGDWSVTADYKEIYWSGSAGYKDFGWEDQSVYAFGAEYRMDKLALRVGFNYGKNPVTESQNSDPALDAVVYKTTVGDTMNTFNAVMFPAVTETHYTFGVGYELAKDLAVDVALTYATSGTHTYSADSIGLGDISVTNDQMAFSANLNFAY